MFYLQLRWSSLVEYMPRLCSCIDPVVFFLFTYRDRTSPAAQGFIHLKITQEKGGFVLGQFSAPFHTVPLCISYYTQRELTIKHINHRRLGFPVGRMNNAQIWNCVYCKYSGILLLSSIYIKLADCIFLLCWSFFLWIHIFINHCVIFDPVVFYYPILYISYIRSLVFFNLKRKIVVIYTYAHYMHRLQINLKHWQCKQDRWLVPSEEKTDTGIGCYTSVSTLYIIWFISCLHTLGCYTPLDYS